MRELNHMELLELSKLLKERSVLVSDLESATPDIVAVDVQICQIADLNYESMSLLEYEVAVEKLSELTKLNNEVLKETKL